MTFCSVPIGPLPYGLLMFKDFWESYLLTYFGSSLPLDSLDASNKVFDCKAEWFLVIETINSLLRMEGMCWSFL